MSRKFVALFMIASFVGAFLLFGVQPMVAKMILPTWGGGANVWNAAMFFFQVALLVGYGIAHLVSRYPSARVVLFALFGIASLMTLPMSPSELISEEWIIGYPVLSCMAAVFLICGIPFILLSTTSPTLQYMYYASADDGTEPYFLFSLSNTGSFAALLLVPFVFEPLTGNTSQSYMWSGLFVVYLFAMACVFAVTRKLSAARDTKKPERTGHMKWNRRAWVVALSAAPSSLLLGVTHHITTDLAPMPMLWVVPLAIYLLTFITSFSGKLRIPDAFPVFGVTLIAAAGIIVQYENHYVALVAHTLGFAVLCQLGHLRLAQFRPEPAKVTEYFLWVSVGGAIGGLFNGLVAPNVFSFPIEYQIAIAACVFGIIFSAQAFQLKEPIHKIYLALIATIFASGVGAVYAPGVPIAVTAVVVIGTCIGVAYFAVKNHRIAAALASTIIVVTPTLWDTNSTTYRSFFGFYRVYEEKDQSFLLSGTTIHGAQKKGDPHQPQMYYASSKFKASVSKVPTGGEVVVIGLGVGGMVPLIEPSAKITYIEIDPTIEEIARNEFDYIGSRDGITTVIGDGRKKVEEWDDASIDLLVVDAFASDAIPLHLVTVEAIETYFKKVKSTGYVVMHVSNRYLAIDDEMARLASALGLLAYHDPRPAIEGEQRVMIVVLSKNRANIQHLIDEGWVEYKAPEGRPWTDDFASIVRAIK